MTHRKLFFQMALLICLALMSARAQAAEVEVQFGAFTLKSLAEECAAEYKHLERDVFIQQIRSAEGKSFYTVRTGPFESAEAALNFIDELSPAPADTPWIMQAGSMQPTARQAKGADSESEQAKAPFQPQEKEPENGRKAGERQQPAASESPDTAKEAAEEEEESDGLWGVAESGETPASAEDGSAEQSAEETPAPGTEAETADEAAEPPATGPAASESVRELQEEVKELREKVQTLLDAQEVREELEATEEEKAEEEEDILSAAGREYTLLQKGRLGAEYKIAYTYFDYDAIREQGIIEHNSEHTIRNTFTLEYPLKNNLTVEASIPFIYKYDKVGSDESRDVTDFGDVDFGLSYQPLKSGPKLPSIIFRTVLTCPMGRDPYDINPDTEISTGSGGYSLQGSMSLSKAVDPIMVFGSLGYTYNHEIDNLDYKLGPNTTLEKYERGDSASFSMGIGYSLSYITSLTLSYSYSYRFEDERYFKEGESQTYQTQTSSSLSLGTSWRLSPKMRMNMSLGIGLAGDDYYTLSFRFPYEFDL